MSILFVTGGVGGGKREETGKLDLCAQWPHWKAQSSLANNQNI